MRAYDELMDVGKARTGECVECVGEELYYREQVGYPCYSQEWMIGDIDDFWKGGYGWNKRKREEDLDERENGGPRKEAKK